MTNEEAIELLKNMHWSITTKMNREVPSSLALNMAIEALGKDTNVPTKEEVIPIDWIESYLSECEVWSIAYYVIKQMLYKWRKEQDDGKTD